MTMKRFFASTLMNARCKPTCVIVTRTVPIQTERTTAHVNLALSEMDLIAFPFVMSVQLAAIVI